jgi:choice-of-anchor C domain-containing protein
VPTPAVAFLLNGSFELPGYPGYTTVPTGSIYITNWKVTSGNVDYGTGPAGTTCQAAVGNCVDLNGSGPGTIQQTFDTVKGATCTVKFYMSRHVNLTLSSATMAVLIDGMAVASSPYTHNLPGVNAANGQWQAQFFNFTAGGASTTLAFQSMMPDAAGPQIDNVSVECAPPPQQGRLKVCKVAGPFVAVGTPFTFHAGTSGPFTVLAGPAPGGTCSLGPTFNVGSPVWVTETVPSGMTVSAITVAPLPRLIGTPNLAGGTVQVTIGSGVTDVTFTNRRQTGFVEICKSFKPAFAGGSYSFTVNPGGLGPFVVPAGGCSPTIEVPAGMVTITEALPPGVQLVACTTLPSTQQSACNLAAGTSIVNVVPGDVSTQTIAIFANTYGPHFIELDVERP